jgi:acyl-coenzyme A synthetase/AMP-(fatty) acid ligase
VPLLIQSISPRKQISTISVPSLESLLATDPVPPYPYTKAFEEGRLEPFVALHTSGSTGFPKPIILTHGTIAPHDTMFQSFVEDERPIAPSSYNGLRVFLGLGLFHSAAICTIAYTIYSSNTTLVFPPPLPVTAEIADLAHNHGRLGASFLAPHILIQIARNPKYLENIQNLRYLSFGGGPLPKEAGIVLKKHSHLFINFGATETGYFALHLNDPEDWEYISFSPRMGCELRPFSQGLYELNFVRDSKLDIYQGIFCTFPSLHEYSTKDLFSKHPTKEGLWRFEGRSDDVVICSTGQKINPMAMETLLSAHPSVKSALVCGNGRIQLSLLLETEFPLNDESDKSALLDEIWSVVELGNKSEPVQGRITKPLIMLTMANKAMVRAGKGTVLRKMTEELYRQELDEVYAALSAHSV